MKRRRTLAIVIAAVAVAVVIVAVGVIGASLTRHSPTTTLVVRLVDAAGNPITSLDKTVEIDLSGSNPTGPPFERYASARPLFCENGHCRSGWAGPVSRGVATFTNLHSKLGYVVQANGGHSFESFPHGNITIAANQTRSVTATLVPGATISGRVFLPGSTRPAAGIEVGALDSGGHVAHRATTKADGSYTLSGLTTGSYRVKFNIAKFGDISGNGGYIWTFARRPIAVNAQGKSSNATKVTGVNASLVVGHTLTLVNGISPSSRVAKVFYIHGGSGNYQIADLTNGSTTGRLPPGNYYIQVLISPKDRDYTKTWWFAGDHKHVVSRRSDAVAIHFAGTEDETVTVG